MATVAKNRDADLSAKPLKRFLMANEHDPNRIERLLFEKIAGEKLILMC